MAETDVSRTTEARAVRGLRPEARTVWLDTLTRDQERACESLVGLIGEAIEDLPEHDEWGRDPTFDRGLDPKQVSRVLLLGGGRGSGKTTVAQTLQEALDQDCRESIYSPKYGDRGEKVKKRRDALAGRVEDLGKRIIPLEILRMTETPPGTNVLAAVLARIEQLVFPHLAKEDVRSMTGDSRQHEAVLDLLRLQTDVAIAWDGNLRERRGHLDPDNYAMEEMRAERVRLQLQDRFETVLRRTARESLGHRDPAMFLLVVDDVDLDPDRLLELLERLRMVAVPELLVLLVGDIDPIETAFRMHFADRYRQAAPKVTPADIAMASQEVAAMTNLIARSALRKYIPYHQRVMLQPRLRARDALKVRPLRRGLEVDRIKELLDRVAVAYPPVPCHSTGDGGAVTTTKLGDFVFPPRRPEQEATKTADGGTSEEQSGNGPLGDGPAVDDDRDEERYWYVGSRLLADSPRVAVDMWYAAFDASETGSEAEQRRDARRIDSYEGTRPEKDAEPVDPRLHTFIRRLAIERVDANSQLWPDKPTTAEWEATQRLLRDGDLTGFKLTAEHRVEDREDQALELDRPKVLRWSRHHGLRFEIRGEAATRVDVGPLVLATDLASLEDRAVAERAMTSRANDWKLAWVCVEDPAAATAAAEQADPEPDQEAEANGGGKTGTAKNSAPPATKKPDHPCKGTPWELPPYRTVRQIEQFGHEWNRFLDPPTAKNKEIQQSAQKLAVAWVVINTNILFGDADVVSPTGDVIGQPTERANERLQNLQDPTEDQPSQDDWATRMAGDWLKSVEKVLDTVGLDLDTFPPTDESSDATTDPNPPEPNGGQ